MDMWGLGGGVLCALSISGQNPTKAIVTFPAELR